MVVPHVDKLFKKKPRPISSASESCWAHIPAVSSLIIKHNTGSTSQPLCEGAVAHICCHLYDCFPHFIRTLSTQHPRETHPSPFLKIIRHTAQPYMNNFFCFIAASVQSENEDTTFFKRATTWLNILAVYLIMPKCFRWWYMLIRWKELYTETWQ